MKKTFYDHLIVIEDIVFVMNDYDIPKEHQKEMISVIDTTLSTAILDEILTHLPKEHHPHFLKTYAAKPHDAKLLEFLKTHAHEGIEIIIFNKGESVKKDIVKTIHTTYKEGKK
jgi:hypothetical protein